MADNEIDHDPPRPRLCHLRRWTDFDGYGFNLHSDRNKVGQYIGKVDENSPAESAGLRKNDRIIEVNYAQIGAETHRQVVTRIKEGLTRNGVNHPEEVILLVVDEETDEYYKSKNIPIRSSDPNVEKLETPIRYGTENDDTSSTSSSRSMERRNSSPSKKMNHYDQEYTNVSTYPPKKNSPTTSRTSDHAYDSPIQSRNHHQYSPPSLGRSNRSEMSPSPPYTQINPIAQASSTNRDDHTTNPSTNGSKGLTHLNMSAAEYREMLKTQKSRRPDPRQTQQLSMKEKRDIINGL